MLNSMYSYLLEQISFCPSPFLFRCQVTDIKKCDIRAGQVSCQLKRLYHFGYFFQAWQERHPDPAI